MNNIKNSFLEDEIFGTSSDSINTLEVQNYQDEIEGDIEDDFIDNTQDKKSQIISTNIICDGKGFKELIESQQNGIDSTPPDFSKYIFDNWRISENEFLIKLEDAGGALILFDDGELLLRSSSLSEFKKVTAERASIVVNKLTGEHVVVGKGSKDRPAEIPYSDLMLVSEIEMNLTAMAEFNKNCNTYKMNVFTPNELLMLDKNTPYRKPRFIMMLILHLANYNIKRFYYIINWLAKMFVSLNKAMTALVLRGSQGSGKSKLVEIISILFGKRYCFTVGNKTLKSQFLGSVFENKLFININEMSHDLKSNKENKNSVKELITEPEFAGEKKYENISKPIKLFAQIIITSNEVYVLEVEPEDRRFTIFTTAGNISNEECNFFGFGDFKSFWNQVMSEIQDFALYLKNYPIDLNMANKPMDTAEKRALIKGTNDRFKLFISNLLNKNFDVFEAVKVTDPITHSNLITGLKKGRIYQKDLLPTFIAMNPSEFNMSTYGLLDKLEIYEPTKFSRDLRKKSGDWYFEL